MLRMVMERVNKRITQKQLSKKTGISTSNISRIENKKIEPFPAWRRRIAEALGFDPEEADRLFEEVIINE